MTPLLQTAGWTLIHFVWQGAAIAGAASALLRLTRRRSASARYVIACVSLAGMLAAPAFTARVIWTGTALAPSPQAEHGDAAALPGRAASTTASAIVSVIDDHAVVALGSSPASSVQRFRPAMFLASLERFLPAITILATSSRMRMK